MNSATSTDPQSLQPWQFFTLAGLVGATIVVFLSEGQTPAGIILLSLVIFGAAAVGIAAWRMFSPLAGANEPAGPQIFGGRTRAALEREKTLVLRSIKELEFDYAMGKVAKADFDEMSARLRARAAGLIRQLDAGGGYKEQVAKEIEQRLNRSEGDGFSHRQHDEPAPASAFAQGASADKKAVALRTGECSQCGTINDEDAKFCKNCGARL